MKKAAVIIFLVLLFDQALKIWVKTTMKLECKDPIFDNWFFIHFTENEGMALGFKLPGSSGKLYLSLFRIIAVIFIGWWLYRVTQHKGSNGLIVCISLIMAGALGNIIDSAFYGLIFNKSTEMQIAQIFPPGGGYASFLHGKVVDMLYFPIIKTQAPLPSWVPFFGGEKFIFFSPIFNIADSSITTGVFMLILFQKKFFAKKEEIHSGND